MRINVPVFLSASIRVCSRLGNKLGISILPECVTSLGGGGETSELATSATICPTLRNYVSILLHLHNYVIFSS